MKVETLTVEIKLDTTKLDKELKEFTERLKEFDEFIKFMGFNPNNEIDMMRALFSFKFWR